MAKATQANATGNDKVTATGEVLPVDPFRSLYVHFGMLLGVEDFRTVDAYHRGKMWFHSGWLHRQGVIWGLAVSIDQERNEIRVEPGAGIDELGRELYLAQPACLNLNSWYNEHKEDAELMEIVVVDDETGAIQFDAHVVIKFKACLNRQVPALTEPCDGGNTATAYSRVVETVDLHLLPGKAPEWRSEPGQLPFHRIRLLFGLEDPILEDAVVIDEDQEVLDAKAEILALPSSDQAAAYLKWLRHFAVLDEMAMLPATLNQGETISIFPAAEPNPIPLADLLQLRLLPGEGGLMLDNGAVDNGIRPVHIPTATIQELVCGPAFSSVPNSPEIVVPLTAATVDDAGGPRVDPDSVSISGETIQFTIVGGPMMKASIDARGISVTSFNTRDGWSSKEIKQVNYDEDNSRIEVELRDAPSGRLVRLIVKGTGEYPFLGRNRIPLAGSTESGPGSEIDGNDFVTMIRVGS